MLEKMNYRTMMYIIKLYFSELNSCETRGDNTYEPTSIYKNHKWTKPVVTTIY